jgi:FkbM family methyltransferase
MRQNLKKLIFKLTPKKLKDLYTFEYKSLIQELKDEQVLFSYSQKGEDVILNSFFEDKTHGFYVDVGAFHPKKYSNTYLFYKKGWTGINIDAQSGVMEAFNVYRKKDINLEIAISDTIDEIEFYIFSSDNIDARSTFSKNFVNEFESSGIKIQKKVILKTQRLSDVLDNYLPINQKIDFFTIDVEGFDLRVLKSNNWNKYRPKMVVVEEFGNLDKVINSEITLFMKSVFYEIIGRGDISTFYRNNGQIL